MSVPGQTLFRHVRRAAVRPRAGVHPRRSGDLRGKKRITSETVPAHGACRREWLEEFSEMEHGAQNWLDEVIRTLPHALTPDTPLRMASEEMRSPISSMRCSSGQSGAQLSGDEPCKRCGGTAQDRAPPRSSHCVSVHEHARGAGDHRKAVLRKGRSSAARSISPAARTGGSAFRTFSSGRRWSIIITTTMPASRMCTISPGPWASG